MRTPSKFDINSFEERLAAKNEFDGNLVFGAREFHQKTYRTGAGRPSSGGVTREHVQVIDDSGVERFKRKEELWEPVDNCPVCHGCRRHNYIQRFGLEIARCEDCGHRYLNPRVKFEEAVKIYGDDRTASDIYTQPMQIEIDEIKYTYGLTLIDQLLSGKHEKILDIGCGAGVFLKVAFQSGWQKCVGADINQNYSSMYQDIPGVQFISSSFEDLKPKFLGDSYDCISLWSVLEHLYELDPFVARAKELLRPGGLLFILVPNSESLATRIIRERSPTFNWKHVSHFTPKSLKTLMARHSLECAHFETVITEIDNIKSYLSGEWPYFGFGDPDHLFDFITPEFIHQNELGSRMIGIFRKD
jgi:2-polyprenyl-3-methyl-5-hydroxy-6-metoxy-1,4-benzoquinol methylase